MNILLIAEESAGLKAFRMLSESEHTLAGVLTGKNNPSKETPVTSAARSAGISVMEARRIKDPGFARWISSNKVDVLLNVHSLFVICPEIIQAVRLGGFNLHPGPLPEYAGLNAPSWAIYNEESNHAVTLHHMAGSVDAGDIIYEAAFAISPDDTGLTLSTKCVQNGLPLIEQLLDDLNKDPVKIPARPQNLSRRRYYKRSEIPGGGVIDWSGPAKKINAFVRACNYAPFPSPWGRPITRLGNKKISILKTGISKKPCNAPPGTIGPVMEGKTAIASSDQWILVQRCFIDGKHVEANTILKPGDVLK